MAATRNPALTRLGNKSAAVDLYERTVQSFRGRGLPQQSFLNPIQHFNVVRGGQSGAFQTLLDFNAGKFDAFLGGTPQANQFLDTAVTGISGVVDVLVDVQGLALQRAAVPGPLTEQTRASVGRAVDVALARLGGVLDLARVSGVPVLGLPGSMRVGDQSAGLAAVDLAAAAFEGSSATVRFQVDRTATEAAAAERFGDQAAAATLKVTGPRGAAFVEIPAGALALEVAARINVQFERTGVRADLDLANVGRLRSEGVIGSDAALRVETVAGSFSNQAGGAFSGAAAFGQDAAARIGTTALAALGNTVVIDAAGVYATVTLAPGATGEQSFTVAGRQGVAAGAGALVAGKNPALRSLLDRLDATPEGLGLDSLRNGGANSLADNPEGALRQIGLALDSLSAQLQELQRFSGPTTPGLSGVTDSYARRATAGLNLLAPQGGADASSPLGRTRLLSQAMLDVFPPVPRALGRVLDYFF